MNKSEKFIKGTFRRLRLKRKTVLKDFFYIIAIAEFYYKNKFAIKLLIIVYSFSCRQW